MAQARTFRYEVFYMQIVLIRAFDSFNSLTEYLAAYFEENEEEFPGLDKIPGDILVKHVIHTWQLALERSEQDGRRRMSMIT